MRNTLVATTILATMAFGAQAATPAKSIPSPDGTILAAGQSNAITDAQGHVWKIANGIIYEDGRKAGYSARVTRLAYVNGSIWQENADNLWWQWSGRDWGLGDGIPTGPMAINPMVSGPVVTASAPASSCGTTAGGKFGILVGQIYTPDQKPFIALGVNVRGESQPTASYLMSTFPGINFVRLPIYDYRDPSTIAPFVQDLTSHGIVVEIEDHSSSDGQNRGGGTGTIFTGARLDTELTWYTKTAAYFANNPYVWYGTDNEPPATDGAGLSNWQKQTYDAIRQGSPDAIIMIETSGGWSPESMNANLSPSAYAGMTNVAWDMHYYGWNSGYSTSQPAVSQNLAAMATNTQRITSAGGTLMPVIVGEYGDSTTGDTIDPNGSQVVSAVGSSGLGSAAWLLSPGNPGDGLLDGGGGLSSYGQQVAGNIRANAAAPTAGAVSRCPATSANGSPTAVTSVALSATSTGYPPQTITAPAAIPPAPSTQASMDQQITVLNAQLQAAADASALASQAMDAVQAQAKARAAGQ